MPFVTWSFNSPSGLKFRGTDGSDQVFYYPRIADITITTRDGKPSFQDRIVVEELAFNENLSGVTFRPTVEDGTNVADGKTGRVIVSGGGPSERLKRLLAKRIDDTKAELARRPLGDAESAVQTPPFQISQLAPWAACGLGVSALLTVWWLKRRNR
jgi:hypothetical protein